MRLPPFAVLVAFAALVPFVAMHLATCVASSHAGSEGAARPVAAADAVPLASVPGIRVDCDNHGPRHAPHSLADGLHALPRHSDEAGALPDLPAATALLPPPLATCASRQPPVRTRPRCRAGPTLLIDLCIARS